MDWNTLTAAIVSSGAIAGVATYVFKLAVERTVDVRLAKLKEETQAAVKEQFRRQAFLWDQEYEVSRQLVADIYRCRNTVRELFQVLRGDGSDRLRDQHVDRLGAYADALTELLYEQRAILPKELFAVVHELKTPLAALRGRNELLRRRHEAAEAETIQHMVHDVELLSAQFEAAYLLVTRTVRERLGLEGTDRESF